MDPIEEPPVERLPRDHPWRPAPAKRPVSTGLAFGVALVADLIQWVLLPFFVPGIASAWNNALDLAVAVIQIRLLGWHWAFLPTFVVELLPVVDLVPTWTLAVWLATRSAKRR